MQIRKKTEVGMWDERNPHGAADSGDDAHPSRYVDRCPKAPPPAPLLSSSSSLPITPNIMKSFALLTASALLSTASAEVHKLKLGKVPLEEQFVRNTFLFPVLRL